MPRLIDFKLDAQTTILVEASDDGTPKGQQRVSAGGAMVETASASFDAALAGIKPIIGTIMGQMQDAAADAQEITVEFGIKLTASAGVVIAKAATEGHCKIMVKWKRP